MPTLRITRFVSCLALVFLNAACTTTFDFVPVSGGALRPATREVAARGKASMRDSNGDSVDLDPSTSVRERDVYTPPSPSEVPPAQWNVNALVAKCGPTGVCVLDDSCRAWEVETERRSVDWSTVEGVSIFTSIVGGIAVGNVACVANDSCGSAGRFTVEAVDVILIGIGVILVEGIARAVHALS